MRRARCVRGGVLAGLMLAMLSVAGVAAADDSIPVDHALFVVPRGVDPVLPVGAPPEFDAPAEFDPPITAHSHSDYAAPVQELRHSAVTERAGAVFPVASVMEPSLPLPPIEPILSPADFGPMLERIGLNPGGPALPSPDRRLVDEALGVIAPSVQQLLPGDLGAGVLAGLTSLATVFGPATVPVDSPDISPPPAPLDAGPRYLDAASTSIPLPAVESVDLAIPAVAGPAAEAAVPARASVEPPVGPIMLLCLIVLGVVIAGLASPLIPRRRAGIRRTRGRRAARCRVTEHRLRPGTSRSVSVRRPGRGGVAVRGDPWQLVERSRCGAGRSPPNIRPAISSEGVEPTAAVEPAAVVSTTLGAAPVT
ncbi:hypothetical protein ACWF82_24005 [Nocardia sp. NPDC055053]